MKNAAGTTLLEERHMACLGIHDQEGQEGQEESHTDRNVDFEAEIGRDALGEGTAVVAVDVVERGDSAVLVVLAAECFSVEIVDLAVPVHLS